MTDNKEGQHPEDDLYEDLKETKPAVKHKLDSQSKSVAVEDHQRVEQLEKRVQHLEKENETLRRNMGTLYRTAKSEMERKDAEIERLMKQIESMNG